MIFGAIHISDCLGDGDMGGWVPMQIADMDLEF